jgi:hypothetical protein
MKHKHQAPQTHLLAIVSCLFLLFAAAPLAAQQKQTVVTQVTPASPADKQATSVFEEHVKQYLKLRSQVKDKVPNISKDSTPEQIDAYRTAFEAAMRAARAGSKRGDIFTPEVGNYIRRTLASHLKGKDRTEIREIVFEAETQGVPIRVNYPYPQSAEFTEMPATLLLKLPQLPKEVKYRFVGRNLLLVDRENNLILDYMPNALP